MALWRHERIIYVFSNMIRWFCDYQFKIWLDIFLAVTHQNNHNLNGWETRGKAPNSRLIVQLQHQSDQGMLHWSYHRCHWLLLWWGKAALHQEIKNYRQFLQHDQADQWAQVRLLHCFYFCQETRLIAWSEGNRRYYLS